MGWDAKTRERFPESFKKAHEKRAKTMTGKHWKKSPQAIENARKANNPGWFKKGEMLGSKNKNWKGGTTPAAKLIRNSREYLAWRKAIFERDDYTCQMCGIRSGNGVAVYLEADHIKPFSTFPELRFELLNGRTLCRPCHKKTPTFGGRARNRGNI